VGVGLTFMYNDGKQWSRESSDTISFPRPVVVPNSLHVPGGTPSNDLAGSSSQGEFVRFYARNVGDTASLLAVYYDRPGGLFNSSTQQCTSLSIPVPYDSITGITVLQCRTQPGTGGPYVFKVVALNAWSDEGTDTYSYPQAPVIEQVLGSAPCVNNLVLNSTANCPTTGGVDITILGSAFTSTGAAVKVGANDCLITFLVSSQIICTLPAGTGLNLAVSVFAANLLSAPAPLLSYQQANITSVSGCATNDAFTTSNCPRLGSTTITITGSSFGASGAQVLVGGSSCSNVVHDSSTPQTKVTCQLPRGVDLDVAVLLLQAGGAISLTTGTVSYVQCAVGYYQANLTDYGCTPCSPGSYTDVTGALACTLCPKGRAQPLAAQSLCDQCVPGKYAPSVGYSDCLNCSASEFALGFGASQCSSCPAGSYRSSQTSCVPCPIGTAYAGDVIGGVTVCANCSTGYFAGSTGQASCTACGLGTYSSVAAATTCIACPVGQQQSSSAASFCSDCAIGSASASTGTITCPSCGLGRFANTTGLTACTACAIGSSQSVTSATVCDVCSAGSYQPFTGQGACITCPAGKYQASSGQSLCVDCSVGTAGTPVAGTGLTACSNCTTGYAASTPGLATCQICSSGRFSGSQGQSVCEQCAPGTFNPSAGSSVCLACGVAPSALGSYNSNSGQSGCASCDIGFFSNKTGVTQCDRCVAGRYSSALGSSFCIDCGVGYITTSDAQPPAGCVACPIGSFSSQPVSTACMPCGFGQSTAGASGAATCTDCIAGTVAAAPGSGVCTVCPNMLFFSSVV
jgi:hypothetical protein